MYKKARKPISKFLGIVLVVSMLAGFVPAMAAAEGANENVASSVISDGFDAETLTLTPGATTSAMGFTWYSDSAEGQIALVLLAKKADVTDGSFPADAILAVGTTGDASEGKVWHKVTVERLEPDTVYAYCVAQDTNTFSKVYEFKTAAADSFRFAVTGDPQLTEGLQDGTSNYRPNGEIGTTREGWQNTMDVIAAKGVDFITGVGDQVDTTNNGNEAEYANFFAPAQMQSIPYAPVVGNHDRHYPFTYHYNLPNEQTFEPIINDGNSTNTQLQEMEVAANYYYLYNNALFVVLNDSGYPQNVEVAADYVALYDQTLATATQAYAGEYNWLFVQHHKSTASVADHLADRDIQYYVEAGFERTMDKYGVDFVLAGHDHVYARSYPMLDGVPDKTGTSGEANVMLTTGGDGADYALNPKGTVYFTATTASGLKYYELFNNAGNLYVKDNSEYPYLVDGLVGSVAYMEWNIPLSTAKYLQNKTPGFLYVTVDSNTVTFAFHDLSGEYLDTPYDSYTVEKREIPPPVFVVDVNPSAFVTKLSGNSNELTITVTVLYSDGTHSEIEETFSIRNNAADTYQVGLYNVYVDTKGNDQIRDCHIVE